MPALARLLFLSFVLAFAVLPPAFAQAPDAPSLEFDDAKQQVKLVQGHLENDADDATLGEDREALSLLATQAQALVDDRAPKLAALDARLKELGDAPPKGVQEAPDIAAQRNDLAKQRAAIDAEMKRARDLGTQSAQLIAAIVEARRARFQAHLTARVASPLSPVFWRELAANLGHDDARFAVWRAGLGAALGDAFAADNRAFALGGIALGLFLIAFGRFGVERWLMRATADRVPSGRLRRSALAFAIVVVATVFSGFGASAIVAGLDWHDAFSDAEKAFAGTLVYAVFLGSYVAGLGRALLSAGRPSWRLPAIPDAAAQRLRAFPLLIAIVLALSIVQRQINSQVGASVWGTILASLVIALLYAALIGWGLACLGRRRAESEGETAPRSGWTGLAVLALWIGVIATLVAAAAGYVALAQQIVRQMVGLGLVAASLYLLVRLLEDLFAAMFSGRAEWARRTLGIEPRLLDQFGVLVTGAVRVGALLLGLFAALRPFGAEPADLAAAVRQIDETKWGFLQPGRIGPAFLVLVLGWLAVRGLQRWLLVRYLPTTRLEAGARSSVTTLVGYLGGVVVVALVLASLGLSLDNIAWVASALSVGIGFGLQAIVQNFVSGLILLVERPVKVGDWVVLGDAEGDIRRINVRATEIQMADRSTVIVPNSELITKSVRNVTLANADGRVRLRLPLPLDADVGRARDLVRATLEAHAGVLPAPAPSVLLDGIDGGALILVATAYIDDPRKAGAIRSELLFDLLARLRGEGIALSSPWEVKLRDAPPPAAAEPPAPA